VVHDYEHGKSFRRKFSSTIAGNSVKVNAESCKGLHFCIFQVKCRQKELAMHLKDEQIHRLAEKILNDLVAAGEVVLKAERGVIIAAMKSAIATDLQAEESLERDAERILKENLAALGRGAVEIDRHKMLRMIKDRLAKERKIVL
jgi:hypothetical protein